MSRIVEIEYLDEVFEVPEEGFEYLKSIDPEEQQKALQEMYLGVKQSRKDREIKVKKSNEAKRILSRFDPKTDPNRVTSMGVGLAPITPRQTETPGLGKGPKEPFIAAALMIPEEDLDTTSGLSYGLRSRLSLLASPEARRAFLEKTTGGKLETLEINGRAEDYIRYPDGKVIQVDERGFRPKDTADMMGEVLPLSAEVIATSGVIKAGAATGGASLLTIGTAGPAAGAAVREFQSIIAQEGIPFLFDGLAPEAQVDFTASLGRAAEEFAFSSGIDLALGGIGKFAYKPKYKAKTLNSKIAETAQKSAKNLNETYKFDIESGALSRVPEAPVIKDDLEFLVGSRPKEMALPVERVAINLKNLPDLLYATERLSKEEVKNTVARGVKRGEEAIAGATKDGTRQASLLAKESQVGLDQLKEFASGGGSMRQAAENASFQSADVVEQTARSIKKESDELYGNVYEAAVDEGVSVPIRELVQAIKGKTIAKKGKKKMSAQRVDAVINHTFNEVLQNYGFKNLDELKDSDFWKNNSAVSFSELDLLYKTNKQAFDATANSKNLAARELDERLNKLRKKTASKFRKTNNALTAADSFYNQTYLPFKNNVYSHFFKSPSGGSAPFALQKAEIGNAGIISILKGDNPIKSIQNIKFARENIDKSFGPNSKQRRLFDQSLRYQLMYKYGFLDEVGTTPKGIAGQEKFLFDEVFGPNMSNTVQSIGKDARILNVEITSKNTEEILKKYVKEGNIEGSKYKNSVFNALKKIEDVKDLEAQSLFNTKNAFEVIQGDLDAAGRIIISKKTNTDSVHSFMKELDPLEKKYFRRATLAALIDKYGTPDGEGLLFNGKKVFEAIENNPSKYYGENGIFGAEGRKKLKSFLELSDLYNLDIKKAAKTRIGQIGMGNRIIWNPATDGGVRIITNLLSNLSPSGVANRIKSKIMASAYITDSFDKGLAKRYNFNVEHDDELINQVLKDMLIKEDGIEFLLGYDDELRATMVGFLGGSGRENPQGQKTFIREAIIDRL